MMKIYFISIVFIVQPKIQILIHDKTWGNLSFNVDILILKKIMVYLNIEFPH